MNSADLASLMERGQACVDMGNIVEASEIFSKVCQLAPENAEAWLMKGALHGEMGALDDAELCLNKAIQLQPNYPEAFLTLAHMRKGRGSINKAYDNAKRAVEIDAEYDEAWVFLGAICCELSYFEEAEHASREAIKRWPENSLPHISLATALCYLGRVAEAEPVVRQAIELGGNNQPSICAPLGRVLIVRGEFEKAEPYINKALSITPNDVNLLSSLAKIKLGQRLFVQAEIEFRKVVEVAPNMADGWNDLGTVLQLQHKAKEAENSYRKAIELAPGSLAPVYNLSLLLELDGKNDEAVDKLKIAHAYHPDNLDVIGLLAGILEKSGKYEEAISVIEPVLSKSDKSVRIAVAFQRLCKKMGKCDEATVYLNDVSKTAIVKHDDRAAVHFALGQLYDRGNKYDEAFENYKKGNEVYEQAYIPAEYSAYIDKIIRIFSASNMSNITCSTNSSEQPVFIVGMPRSGTSLVEQILSSHSKVFGAGELGNLIELSEKIAITQGLSLAFPDSAEQMTQQTVDSLSIEYLDFISKISAGASRVTDKLPHNFQNLGLIQSLFPGAKIIHCIRDPKDTCLSCYFQNFSGNHPYNYDLEHLGQHYRDYQRLMAHWRSVSIPMLEVRYEDLIDDQKTWSKRLIEYCDLQWEDQCLSFYKSGRATKTASYDQVRQPIYKTSKQRWLNYEKHLAPLLNALEE